MTGDLVDDDQSFQVLEDELRVLETGRVRGVLKVKERDRTLHLSGQRPGQRGLSDLPRAHEADHRKLAEKVA